MKRIWKFVGFVFALALLLTLVVSGALAQLPVVPKVQPPDSKYVSGEVLVKFHGAPPGTGHGSLRGAEAVEYVASLPAQARFALGEIRGKAVRAFPRLGVLQVELPVDLPVPEALEMLKRSGAAEHAEPNFLFFACPKPPAPGPRPKRLPQTFPNDYYFGIQWALHNTGQIIYEDWFLVYGTKDADIDAPEAWAISTDGSNTLVVVIDTGVDYNHPDLLANMWVNTGETPGDGKDNDNNGYVDDVHGINAITGSGDPMDGHGHGTHCAGIIGAQGNNGIGVSGVNWKAQIMALKFLDDGGSGDEAGAIECIDYALNVKKNKGYPRMVMSASWGSYSAAEFLRTAIDNAGQAGVLFVAAAGNEGVNTDVQPFYPAAYGLANIISVGASDEDDLVCYSIFASNYGAQSVDLFAPGNFIASTYPTATGSYAYMDGTSMAAPHVSGAAALVWSRSQAATLSTIKSLILNNADKKLAFSNKCVTGGRLNLYNALKAATP